MHSGECQRMHASIVAFINVVNVPVFSQKSLQVSVIHLVDSSDPESIAAASSLIN